MSEQPSYHKSVLIEETVRLLDPQSGEVAVDATLGHGGHSLQICMLLGQEGLLVGLDRDPEMLETARRRISSSHAPCSRCLFVRADHADLVPVVVEALAQAEVEPPRPDLLLFDLGPSTPQLQDPARGMSWRSEVSLDMRMNPDQPGETAADIVNTWDERRLAAMFKDHSDERWAKRIAQFVVKERAKGAITTGVQLAQIVEAAIPRKAWPPNIHPATRVFLSLRIQVNREYETLEQILPAAFKLLKPNGRMAVITFHGGEDKRVKDFMRQVTTPPEKPVAERR